MQDSSVPCPYLHRSCMRRHKFPSMPTASNGSSVPAPCAAPPPTFSKLNDANPQLYLFVVVVVVFLLRFARLECARLVCAGGATPFLSASADALALLIVSENDIGEDDDDGDVPVRASPAIPRRGGRSSGDGGDRCCCCCCCCCCDCGRLLVSEPGVARHEVDLPPSSSSSSLVLSADR